MSYGAFHHVKECAVNDRATQLIDAVVMGIVLHQYTIRSMQCTRVILTRVILTRVILTRVILTRIILTRTQKLYRVDSLFESLAFINQF